ncbi:hypothetical protein DFH08DRAFT_889794 [Mycena albidolilacea]|uniref:GST N-terminal domain-containing protein n=1 Tax=Mycena albidolilacea TaxID=1033008 RepID=A0AAD6ZFQ3_9AGAR|nr:hypothetical protein DFH08DRAFT_889794 [Mycena albidolilacea]
MSTSIVFYDIPSTLPNCCWSPNLWKSRYALNFKGIPYTTVWLEYPEIEEKCKEIGASPTRNKPDGRPHYTLPMIHDLATGAVISDSAKIAAYLDATYPDKPMLMPAGTAGLHRAFEDAAHALISPIYPYGLPAAHKNLNPVSAEYFRRTREVAWGKTLEDLTPKGDEDAVEWKKLKDGFGKLDEWIRVNGPESPYFMGDTPCYADLWTAAYVMWIRLVLPGKWEEVKSWHEGRWAKLLKGLEEYETVL